MPRTFQTTFSSLHIISSPDISSLHISYLDISSLHVSYLDISSLHISSLHIDITVNFVVVNNNNNYYSFILYLKLLCKKIII